jgi:hypothetical protein
MKCNREKLNVAISVVLLSVGVLVDGIQGALQDTADLRAGFIVMFVGLCLEGATMLFALRGMSGFSSLSLLAYFLGLIQPGGLYTMVGSSPVWIAVLFAGLLLLRFAVDGLVFKRTSQDEGRSA